MAIFIIFLINFSNMYCEKKMIFLFVIIFLVEFSIGRKLLPSYFTKCKYSTDKYELGNCVLKSYKESQQELHKGIPNLHFPVLDPFHMEEIHFSFGEINSPINFQVSLTNISVTGTANIVLSNLTIDLENAEMTGNSYFAHFDAKCAYNIEGKIMVMSLDSIGNADMKLADVYTRDKYRGKKVVRNGSEYLDFTEGESVVNIVGRSTMYLDNIINGNPQLTESMNVVLNANIDNFKNELNNAISGTLGQVRLSLLHSIFGLVALEDIFIK